MVVDDLKGGFVCHATERETQHFEVEVGLDKLQDIFDDLGKRNVLLRYNVASGIAGNVHGDVGREGR
jgi:hypothetical protein